MNKPIGFPQDWTCPECGDTHKLPKSGPFRMCCIKNIMAQCASEVTGEPVDASEIHGPIPLPEPAKPWESDPDAWKDDT